LTRIVLHEWELSNPLPILKDEVPIIQRRLNSLAEVVYDLDGVKIKAKSNIGYIPVNEDIQLIIVPKIDNFADFFYVLERSGMTPKVWMDYSIFVDLDESEREDVPLFLIRTLLQKLRYLKRDGFYRRSIACHEIRSSVKGKIEITNTLRQCQFRGNYHLLYCNYFDPTTDTIENRFIKYTIWRLLRVGLPRDIKRELRHFWRIFANIPLSFSNHYLTEIEYIIRRRRLPSSRSYYLDILSICFLILENSTVLIKAGEEIKLSAFTIKMDVLFEKYIRKVLFEELHPDLLVFDGNKNSRPLFSDTEKPQITPDIMIYDSKECKLVADTKYKEIDLPSVDDWYQVISYTLALNVSDGVLIYSANEPRPPQCFHIEGKTLWVYYYSLQSPKPQEDALITFMKQRLALYNKQ
jgi:5-methylcytosine-specific restriction endonuclease McrBC regulatory subunit McrC